MSDTLRMLKTHCDRQGPARVVSGDLQHPCRARFFHVSERMLIFEILEDVEDLFFRPLSVCVVSFSDERRGCLFLSSVLDFKVVEEGPPRLILRTPTDVLAAETRSAFRVPITRASNLKVTASKEEGTVNLTPSNISLGGILVECPEDCEIDLKMDAEVRIDLTLGDLQANVLGVVRRNEGLRVGFFFPESVRGPSWSLPYSCAEL